MPHEKQIARVEGFASSCYSNRQAELSAKAEQGNLWTNVVGWVPGFPSVYILFLLEGLYPDLYTQLSYSFTCAYSTKSYYYDLRDGRGLTTVLTHAIHA
jgi:hypothetical protein